MPTLIRFVVFLAALAALIYGAMFSLANFVKIPPHEITVTVDLSKAQK